jgi:hypothetical protein
MFFNSESTSSAPTAGSRDHCLVHQTHQRHMRFITKSTQINVGHTHIYVLGKPHNTIYISSMNNHCEAVLSCMRKFQNIQKYLQLKRYLQLYPDLKAIYSTQVCFLSISISYLNSISALLVVGKPPSTERP